MGNATITNTSREKEAATKNSKLSPTRILDCRLLEGVRVTCVLVSLAFPIGVLLRNSHSLNAWNLNRIELSQKDLLLQSVLISLLHSILPPHALPLLFTSARLSNLKGLSMPIIRMNRLISYAMFFCFKFVLLTIRPADACVIGDRMVQVPIVSRLNQTSESHSSFSPA